MILPALVPLVFGGQVVSALVTALANLVLLALVYLVIGFGLVFIVRWAARQLPGGLTASLSVLTRAVPLLLVFSLVLFINTEMWQVFSLMPRAYLAAAALLLALVTASFLFGRLPREVLGLQGPDDPPLNRPQRINVGLVMFVSQALQVLVVQRRHGGLLRRLRRADDRARGARRRGSATTAPRSARRSRCWAAASRSPRSCCASQARSPRSAASTTRSPC